MMTNLKSPLTNSKNLRIDEQINTSFLIKMYQEHFNIDVSKYFEGIENIQLYTCLDTDYQFYYPFELGGDGKFYEQLQTFDWYYTPWKWEHQKASEFLSPEMKVLELGCAKGDFLYHIKDKVASVKGLELNQKAMQIGQAKGLDIEAAMIDLHAQKCENYYDFVCSFQVLEHINMIQPFLESQIKTLKKGGLLWISVPNRNSFAQYDRQNHILDMPPHHMGLWSESSLRSLEQLFPIRLQEIIFEPLQEYHYQWYQRITESLSVKNKWQSFVYNYLGGRKKYAKYIRDNAKNIQGHTIAAIFRKN